MFFVLICSLLLTLTFASAAGTLCVLDEKIGKVGNVSRKKIITILLGKHDFLVHSESAPYEVKEFFLETAYRAATFGDLASFKWLEQKFSPAFFQENIRKLCARAMEGNQNDMVLHLTTRYRTQPSIMLATACASGIPTYVPKDSGMFSADNIELAAFASFFGGYPAAIHRFVENFKTRFPALPSIAFDYAVARGFPVEAEDLLDRHAITLDPAAIALAFSKRNEDVLRFLLRRGLLVRPYSVLPGFLNEENLVKPEVRARFDQKYDEKLPTYLTGLHGYQQYLDALVAKSFFELIPIAGKGATLGGLGMIHLAEMSLAGSTDSLLLLFLPFIANLRLASAQRFVRSMNKKGATKESVIQSSR